jgi:anti-sigma regulatory factor (Ser/Thr protein kinase)
VRATSSMLVPLLPPSASAVRRRFVGELRARGLPGLVVDDATLVLSELVGNAIRHGAELPEGGIRVTWRVSAEVVHVEVADGGRGPLRHEATTPPIGGGSADAERGRGLAIVGMLSSSWGSAFDSTAAVVWADISVRQQLDLAAERDARQEA